MNNYQKAAAFLKQKLDGGKNIDETEKKYRFEHSLRVAAIAQRLAKKEGCDVFVATMAGILHDVGKYDTDINKDHGRVSADIARPFLQTLKLSEKQESDILYCIAAHVDDNAGYEYPHITEADTVSDADNIDRFGVYRIYQCLSFAKIESAPLSENIKNYKAQIDGLKSLKEKVKLSTKSANIMFEKNLNIQIGFYKNLVKELELSGGLKI